MPYKITKGNSKELLKHGQFVKLNIEYKLKSKDTVLNTSYGHIPMYFYLDSARLGKYTFTEVITKCAPGDKMEFSLSIDSLKKMGMIEFNEVFKSGDFINGKLEVIAAFAKEDLVKADYEKEVEKEKATEIAEVKKYDFILDKSSDLTILFAAKRHDISDQVIRSLTRASKREQMSKKELKALEEKERIQDYAEDINPDKEARKKILEDRQKQRDSIIEARKALSEQKKKDFEDKRKKLIEERAAKKNGTVSDKDKQVNAEEGSETTDKSTETVEEKSKSDEPKTDAAETKKKAEEERQKKLDERKKQLEERKQKILADREAAKKAKEEKQNENKEENKNNN